MMAVGVEAPIQRIFTDPRAKVDQRDQHRQRRSKHDNLGPQPPRTAPGACCGVIFQKRWSKIVRETGRWREREPGCQYTSASLPVSPVQQRESAARVGGRLHDFLYFPQVPSNSVLRPQRWDHEDMVRTHIRPTENQIDSLRRLSATSGRSIADLIREAVERLGKQGAADLEQRTKRALGVAGRFSSGASDMSAHHDDYLANAFNNCGIGSR